MAASMINLISFRSVLAFQDCLLTIIHVSNAYSNVFSLYNIIWLSLSIKKPAPKVKRFTLWQRLSFSTLVFAQFLSKLLSNLRILKIIHQVYTCLYDTPSHILCTLYIRCRTQIQIKERLLCMQTVACLKFLQIKHLWNLTNDSQK